jgi:hypothetical protein
MVLAAETRTDCNDCRFQGQNRRRIAIALSKTALEAMFGALEGDVRCLSAHAQIGFEITANDHTVVKWSRRPVSRLGSAPRHLLYMSGTSQQWI